MIRPGAARRGLRRALAELAAFASRRRIGAAAAPTLSPGAKWQLLEAVHAQWHPLFASVVVILSCGIPLWWRTHSPWVMGWTVSGLLVTFARLVQWWRFSRGKRRGSPEAAMRGFTVLALAIGALWGAASAIVLITPDQLAWFLAITCQGTVLAQAIARNNPILPAAIGQALCVLVPMSSVCLSTRDPFLQAFGGLALLDLIAMLGTVRTLHRQTLRLLLADEKNEALLRTVNAANQQLETSNRQLHRLANLDALTGIANRRSFDLALAAACRQANERGADLALLLADVDLFKTYNDRLGHQAGDDCLCRVAAAIAGALRRPGDLAARYGGEEFVVILPDTDDFGAIDTGERIRAAVADLALPSASAEGAVVTVSIGACSMRGGAVSGDGLLALADQRLYEAKRAGRNQVRGFAPQIGGGTQADHESQADARQVRR